MLARVQRRERASGEAAERICAELRRRPCASIRRRLASGAPASTFGRCGAPAAASELRRPWRRRRGAVDSRCSTRSAAWSASSRSSEADARARIRGREPAPAGTGGPMASGRRCRDRVARRARLALGRAVAGAGRRACPGGRGPLAACRAPVGGRRAEGRAPGRWPARWRSMLALRLVLVRRDAGRAPCWRSVRTGCSLLEFPAGTRASHPTVTAAMSGIGALEACAVERCGASWLVADVDGGSARRSRSMSISARPGGSRLQPDRPARPPGHGAQPGAVDPGDGDLVHADRDRAVVPAHGDRPAADAAQQRCWSASPCS